MLVCRHAQQMLIPPVTLRADLKGLCELGLLAVSLMMPLFVTVYISGSTLHVARSVIAVCRVTAGREYANVLRIVEGSYEGPLLVKYVAILAGHAHHYHCLYMLIAQHNMTPKS